ncbi:tail fiber assembly protein, partial [Escherichia coli]|uniref:tail fiber assembly protein n=1 Tax=Escherichia coli TaxID=562 RepID=UPI001F4A03A9
SDGNGSHASTLKSPSYTKSVSWQHYQDTEAEKLFRIREAEETKNSLMQVASEHIAPLQDAVDLEIATEEETLLLEAWKKYRVLLNRVNTTTAPDIEWPTVPIIE